MTPSSPVSRPHPAGGLWPALTPAAGGAGEHQSAAGQDRELTGSKIRLTEVSTVSGDCRTARAAVREPHVVVYPLASSGGERFPFLAPDAESFVLGRVADEADLFFAHLLGNRLPSDQGSLERLCLDYLDFLGAPTGGPTLSSPCLSLGGHTGLTVAERTHDRPPHLPAQQ